MLKFWPILGTKNFFSLISMNETLLPNHGNNIDNWYLLIAPIQIRLILSQTVPDVLNISTDFLRVTTVRTGGECIVVMGGGKG